MRISNWVVQNARLIVFFVMVIVNPANADVRIIEWKSMVRGSAATDKSTKLIEIRGEISGKDVASLMGFLPSYPGPIVALDSRGGDVEAAIKIGQLLRKWSRQVVIRPNAVCISACVLVLAGAESRWVYGKVGIHRPYFTNDVAIEALAQKENYMRVEALIKTYLEEVNVRSVLYDDMLRISPSKVRFLSQEELESYGIGESDPYAEEARTTVIANNLNLSKAEYLRRQAIVKRECPKIAPEYGECAVAIEYGISIAEYRRRIDIAKNYCVYSQNPIDRVRCEEKITRGSALNK